MTDMFHVCREGGGGQLRLESLCIWVNMVILCSSYLQRLALLVIRQHLTEMCFHIDSCFDSLDHRLPLANF